MKLEVYYSTFVDNYPYEKQAVPTDLESGVKVLDTNKNPKNDSFSFLVLLVEEKMTIPKAKY